MRRRDARGCSIHYQQRHGWPTAAAAVLSVCLHVALLGAATVTVLRAGANTRLIRVSLASGSQVGVAPGEGHPAGEALQPLASPPEAVHPAQPKPPSRRPATPQRWSKQPRPTPPFVASAAIAPSHSISVQVDDGPSAAGAEPGRASDSGAAAGQGTGDGIGFGAAGGVDQRASCVYCPEPRYPLIARARGWQGTVDVGLLVLADGSVDAAKLRRSSGFGVLDQAAVAVARQSRFSPPAAQGLPTPLRGRIEYRFELTTAR